MAELFFFCLLQRSDKLQAIDILIPGATWIGNDYAHYESKHIDIDLVDLKQLIELSVREIESEIKKKNYIAKITSLK